MTLQNVNNNQATTNLDGALTDSATTITVDSTTGFPTTDSVIVIGSERIFYTGTTATTFTGCTRGYDDSTAAAHSDNAPVAFKVTAKFLQDVKGALSVAGRIYSTSDQTISTTSTYTEIAFDSSHFNYGSCVSLSDNGFEAPADGVYQIGIWVTVDTAQSDFRIGFAINDTQPTRQYHIARRRSLSANDAVYGTRLIELSANDIVTFEAFLTTSGDIRSDAWAGTEAWFSRVI